MAMSQEEAAKYFIIGWVKGWSLRMYLFTICEVPIGATDFKRVPFDEAHDAFKWLPDDPFIFLTGVTCQRFITDNYPRLNEALFNCADNRERLKLYKTVLACDGAGAIRRISQKMVRERKAFKRETKIENASNTANALSIAARRRGSGHAWNVCK